MKDNFYGKAYYTGDQVWQCMETDRYWQDDWYWERHNPDNYRLNKPNKDKPDFKIYDPLI